MRDASRCGRLGRFQLEAAIQSAHARRRRVDGTVNWPAIEWLYEGIVRLYPTIGARLGQAAAVAESRGVSDAEALLASMPAEAVIGHQPYWALRAHLHARAGRGIEAAEAYSRAIGLCSDDAMRRFLLAKSKA